MTILDKWNMHLLIIILLSAAASCEFEDDRGNSHVEQKVEHLGNRIFYLELKMREFIEKYQNKQDIENNEPSQEIDIKKLESDLERETNKLRQECSRHEDNYNALTKTISNLKKYIYEEKVVHKSIKRSIEDMKIEQAKIGHSSDIRMLQNKSSELEEFSMKMLPDFQNISSRMTAIENISSSINNIASRMTEMEIQMDGKTRPETPVKEPLQEFPNVAIRVQATQSSTFKNRVAGFAVDGIHSTNLEACSQTDIGDNDRWLLLNLGKTAIISSISMLNRYACEKRLADITILVGNSVDNMKVCALYPGPGDVNEMVTITCLHSMPGQYVRVTGGGSDDSCHPDEFIQIAELIVRGFFPEDYINLALGGLATQSSRYKNLHASYAIDDKHGVNYLGCSHTEIGDQDRWWMVDLQQTAVVYGITMLNRDECGKRLADITVFVGSSRDTMEHCVHYAGPAADSETVIVSCVQPLTGQFVRLTGGGTDDSCQTDRFIQLCEVEVIGYV